MDLIGNPWIMIQWQFIPPEYTELTHQLHGVFETAEVEMGWEE